MKSEPEMLTLMSSESEMRSLFLFELQVDFFFSVSTLQLPVESESNLKSKVQNQYFDVRVLGLTILLPVETHEGSIEDFFRAMVATFPGLRMLKCISSRSLKVAPKD